MEILASINSAISILKRINDANNQIKNAEFANLLADLSIELSEMKAKIADLQLENTSLRLENAGFKNQNNISEELFLKDRFYFDAKDDGPFCVTCYEQSEKKVRLTANSVRLAMIAKYFCPVCKHHYN